MWGDDQMWGDDVGVRPGVGADMGGGGLRMWGATV